MGLRGEDSNPRVLLQLQEIHKKSVFLVLPQAASVSFLIYVDVLILEAGICQHQILYEEVLHHPGWRRGGLGGHLWLLWIDSSAGDCGVISHCIIDVEITKAKSPRIIRIIRWIENVLSTYHQKNDWQNWPRKWKLDKWNQD